MWGTEVAMPARTMLGRVKWFNAARGYGFVWRSDGQGAVFVHHTQIDEPGRRELKRGALVRFELEADARGTHAAHVRTISDPEPRRAEQ